MAFYKRYHQPPALKRGVDIQLQSAFADENWPTALRLADRRLKLTGDAYYEVLKVCIESRQDGITERCAAAVVVDTMLRNNTTPADLEAIEMLEWACVEAQLVPVPPLTPQQQSAVNGTAVFSHTFGTLRLRWVKANPRKAKEDMACLRECLMQWDLVNAQQIAAVLDKSSNANDRRFMYWNILLTHMLSTSPQCPPAKQKIYGMLARKQLEKAAEPAEANGVGTDGNATTELSQADRSLRDEEDFLLYFRVLAAYGTPENYRQRALHPSVGAARQFVALGRKQLFLEALTQLETAGDWDAVFSLCQQALSEQPDALTSPPTLGCDLRVWKSLVTAAQRRADTKRAFDKVQDLLESFITAEPRLPPLYAKNTSLALLLTVFSLPPSLLPQAEAELASSNGDTPLSPRVEQLLIFIEAYLDKAAIFGDIKKFVEQLTFAEANNLLERMAANHATDDGKTIADPGRRILRSVLLYKLRYLILSNPATAVWPKFVPGSTFARNASKDANMDGTSFVPACKFCGRTVAEGRAGSCTACLTSLATESLQLHSQLSADKDGLVRPILPRLDKDPRIDLTLVAVGCLLRLAGMTGARKQQQFGRRGWYLRGGAAHVLRAALLLDAQQRMTPDDAGLRLLVLRILVRLGSCTPANLLSHLWQPLDVKNAILDALGPLFYDRLSTVAPGLFLGSRPLLEPLHVYYDTVLRHPSPVMIWEAFVAGSYSSILDMAAYQEKLQRSCTRAMAIVEERRVARMVGAKLEDVEEVAIFSDITNDTHLVNATDLGSMPNIEHSHNAVLANILALGPGLSNTRMHIGLLSERYLDLINFVPAKDYKPVRPGEAAAAERAFLLETLDVLQSSLQDSLHDPGARAHLTHGEFAYATVVSALATFSALALAPATPDEPFPTETLGVLSQTITTMVQLLRASALGPLATASPHSLDTLLCDFGNLHALAMLRDAAMATYQTAVFLAAFHDKEMARDRSGKSGLAKEPLAKEVLAQVRQHKTLAAQALGAAKAHIKSLKEMLGESGWLDRVSDAVVGEKGTESGNSAEAALSCAVVDAVGGSVAVEDWVGQLLDGWRDTVKGWGAVQME